MGLEPMTDVEIVSALITMAGCFFSGAVLIVALSLLASDAIGGDEFDWR